MKMNEKLEIMLSRKRIKKTDFAHSIGITYRAFANYLNGTRNPRAETLQTQDLRQRRRQGAGGSVPCAVPRAFRWKHAEFRGQGEPYQVPYGDLRGFPR